MPTQSERSTTARKALLRSAAELIGNHGTEISVAEIGLAAGMSRSAVNFHFHSKGEMLSQVARYAAEQLRQRTPGSAPWASLSEAIDAHCLELVQDPKELRASLLLAHAALGPHPELRRTIATDHKRLINYTEGLLGELATRGAVQTRASQRPFATAIVAALTGLAMAAFTDGADLQSGYSEFKATFDDFG